MPKILDVETKLLALLKNAKFGYSVSKIADLLGYSRTTITKYLLLLEKSGQVFIQNIGQYKVWHHAEGFYKKTAQDNFTGLLFQPFYNSMMKNLPLYGLTDDQIKNLGQKISTELNLSELSEEFLSLTASSIKPEKKNDLRVIADVIMEIINLVFSGIDEFTWQTPVFFKSEKFFILRMQDSNLHQIPAHFHLLCGLIQTQIEIYIPIEISIQQINEKEKIVDMKFHLK